MMFHLFAKKHSKVTFENNYSYKDSWVFSIEHADYFINSSVSNNDYSINEGVSIVSYVGEYYRSEVGE